MAQEVAAAVDAAEEVDCSVDDVDCSELKAAAEIVVEMEEAAMQQEAAAAVTVEAVTNAVDEVETEGGAAAEEAAAKVKAKEQAEAAVVAVAGAVTEPITTEPTRPKVGDEVSFVDTDGDVVAIKVVSRGVVDFYINGELKIKDSVMLQTGSSLELRGIDVSSWLYKLSNGNFVEEIVEQTTPPEPADIVRALKLLS